MSGRSNPFRRLLVVLAVLMCAAILHVSAFSDSDDFERADTYPTTDLGTASWTIQNGGLTLFSGQATGYAPSGIGWAYRAGTYANNQFSEAVITMHGEEGVTVRSSGTGGTMTLYYARAWDVFGWGIYEVVNNGTPTALQFDFDGSDPFVAGDTMRLEVTGSSPATLTLYRNGTMPPGATVTSSTIASGAPGFWTGDSGSRFGSWSGGDLGGGAPTCTKGLLLLGAGGC